MTDDMERYYYWKDGNWEQISDESTTNNFYTLEQCANELNRLNEENEQLKTTIQQLTNDNTKQKKLLNTTMKENEQLKSLIRALKKSNTDYVTQIKKAYDEKLSIRELADNCGVDLE